MTRFIDFEELSLYPEADQSPGFLLWRVHLMWKRKVEAALTAHDLTHVQFVLIAGLGYLAKDGAAVPQNDLAKLTYCDVTMASQVLRGLEKKGLIQRVHKEGDARAKYSTLTGQGLAKLKGAIKDVEAVDEKFFNVLGDNKLAFVRHLQQLISV